MKTLSFRLPRYQWLQRLAQVFNLNDSRWGRGDVAGQRPDHPGTVSSPDESDAERQRPQGQRSQPEAGPPDLDELWRDFNRKLGGMFGNKRPDGGPANGGPGGPGPGGFQPDMKSAGIGVGLIFGVAFLIWMGTGFFIVQEGYEAVITQFGRYKSTVTAGLNWRLPYPIQRHELVLMSLIQSVDIGRDNILKATGLKESAMLTQDENILDIKFVVQYRLKDARAYLFESKNPPNAVVQAAETAVREVIGRMKMDAALSEERDQIAPRVRSLMQDILDRYNIGVDIVGVNLEQGGVRPPDQVQGSFDDVLKAGQERERTKNEAQAYANDVIPRAVGSASRLKEEAQAYKARVVAQAEGDAQRFRSVLAEYQKAPRVTRDRMYLDAMQQIYSNVTKLVVDAKQGNSMLYLPLDKLMQATSAAAAPAAVPADPAASTSAALPAPGGAIPSDARSRDAGRSRDRELR